MTQNEEQKAMTGTPTEVNEAIYPDYYRAENGLTVIDFIQAFNLNFARGNVIKYLVRAGRKDGENEIKDLLKASTYLIAEITAYKRKWLKHQKESREHE